MNQMEAKLKVKTKMRAQANDQRRARKQQAKEALDAEAAERDRAATARRERRRERARADIRTAFLTKVDPERRALAEARLTQEMAYRQSRVRFGKRNAGTSTAHKGLPPSHARR